MCGLPFFYFEKDSKMNEKLIVMELLKRAAKLLFSNINLAFFLFFSSLPLFCFLILFELSLQTTISLTYQNLDEVIARANNSRYGLAAGVFTHNLDTANRLMRALRVGSVWINCFDVFDATIPFGGYKMSGIGREKGIYSLNNYLQVKAVVTAIKNPAWL
ncbi:hypothetical protein F2Q68_00014042 [Brassica cretica]|uniref:Aldehyde dehydrogenase domain-containing protein n=1 Tax=Brassica cretica TaxID=69181 RepID=A0A8S9HE84_BRACR|nr:hypothetical protein F2Q68_00014042 [Brassica cretica]